MTEDTSTPTEGEPDSVSDDAVEAVRRRACEVVGAFRSGKHDVSERHDDYLAEAYRGEEKH